MTNAINRRWDSPWSECSILNAMHRQDSVSTEAPRPSSSPGRGFQARPRYFNSSLLGLSTLRVSSISIIHLVNMPHNAMHVPDLESRQWVEKGPSRTAILGLCLVGIALLVIIVCVCWSISGCIVTEIRRHSPGDPENQMFSSQARSIDGGDITRLAENSARRLSQSSKLTSTLELDTDSCAPLPTYRADIASPPPSYLS